MADTMQYFSFGSRWGGACFQLAKPYSFITSARPNKVVSYSFITLYPNGVCYLAAGFAWDGASGLLKQIQCLIRGSAEHDAIYRLIREGLLPPGFKAIADAELRTNVIKDGGTRAEADIVYEAVTLFGISALEGGNPVLSIP